MKLTTLQTLLIAVVALGAQTSAVAQGIKNSHGVSIGSTPKYGPDFKFEWSNPSAPRGGRLVLSSIGTFDSLNPFAIKNTGDSLQSPTVRLNFVFQNLGFDSVGEPFTQYGLLVKTFDVADDGLSATYNLNPKAKFSDGHAVTTDDVAFSFKTLMSDKAPPHARLYYADVKDFTVLNKQSIRFNFKTLNRELPLILAELPVFPKHVYGTGKDFVKGFVRVKPIGSGPYTVKSYDFGKQIVYERNKNWWGDSEPFSKGMWNFDEIVVKYYKDPSARMEAFKAGEFDFREENSSRAWAVDHTGEKWDKNWIRKELWKHNRNGGGQGYTFDNRRPLFKDRMVRKAIAVAFDFDWANETLFFKQYTQSSSYFNNSEFNAKGLPDAKELELLNPLKDKLPPEVFTEPKDILGKGLSGKQRLGEAVKILKQAGWEIKDGKMVDSTGKQMSFVILENDPVGQRLADPFVQSLTKIGINASVKLEDQANYIKRVESHDFDVISNAIGQSESPGNEQRDQWSSAAANQSESRNYGGVSDPAIDSLVETLIRSTNRESLITATRALDRVLWYYYPQVPHYFMAADRVSIWNRIALPEVRAPFSEPTRAILQYGWYDKEIADALTKAISTNSKL